MSEDFVRFHRGLRIRSKIDARLETLAAGTIGVENDGSLGSDIQKMLKRKMAGGNSRELSVKVFAGQCRLIELGFRQGGAAGFGLRRQLVDERGAAKAILKSREQKSLQTDRVVLVPGPTEEIMLVRRVYREFVEEGLGETEIAAGLNADSVLTDLCRPWTRGTVHQVLVDPKCAGDNVWSRGSFKLKQRRFRNTPEMWVRAERAFAPVIDRLTFEAAQAIVAARSARLTDAEMLRALRQLLERHGALSALIIGETDECPSSSAYQSRFGSLLRTYALIGYRPHRDFHFVDCNRRLREAYPRIVAETIELMRAAGAVIDDLGNGLLEINREITAAIVLSRCRATRAGSKRWLVRLDHGTSADIDVVVRMEAGEAIAHDYYLFPSIDAFAERFRLQDRNEAGLNAYRFDTL